MTFSFSYSLTSNINKEHKDLILLKKDLEQKVIERTHQLEQEKQQKERFFINIAHEIKTPLTLVINSFTDFYNSYPNPGKLELTKTGLYKLKRDIVNFMDLQKLESGNFYYNHDQHIDCTKIIREIVSLYTTVTDKKGIQLHTFIPLYPVYITIDPCAFERIIFNLIDNALKYNKTDGSLSISLETNNRKTILCIKDTGIGIPEDLSNKIFLPYYQLSQKKQNIQGMGMGLAIVKEICDDIGAKIILKSEEGQGTEFTITFKQQKKNSENSMIDYQCNRIITSIFDDDEYPELPVDKEKASLLLVEDNPSLLQFLIDKLKSTYNVSYAKNGADALKIMKTMSALSLIISDIMMDTMDGLTFRKKIIENNNYNQIPFVFITAKSCEKTKLECLAGGAVDYITKPFSMDELLYKVRTLIKMRRALSNPNLAKIEKRVNTYLKNNKRKPDDRDVKGKGSFYTQHGISDQEIRVISMLKEGLMYKEIAANLNISLNSVRTYIRRIHKKLDIHSTAELCKCVS